MTGYRRNFCLLVIFCMSVVLPTLGSNTIERASADSGQKVTVVLDLKVKGNKTLRISADRIKKAIEKYWNGTASDGTAVSITANVVELPDGAVANFDDTLIVFAYADEAKKAYPIIARILSDEDRDGKFVDGATMTLPHTGGLDTWINNNMFWSREIPVPVLAGLPNIIDRLIEGRANPDAAIAHEVGHLLGLRHTFDRKDHLMYPSSKGVEQKLNPQDFDYIKSRYKDGVFDAGLRRLRSPSGGSNPSDDPANHGNTSDNPANHGNTSDNPANGSDGFRGSNGAGGNSGSSGGSKDDGSGGIFGDLWDVIKNVVNDTSNNSGEGVGSGDNNVDGNGERNDDQQGQGGNTSADDEPVNDHFTPTQPGYESPWGPYQEGDSDGQPQSGGGGASSGSGDGGGSSSSDDGTGGGDPSGDDDYYDAPDEDYDDSGADDSSGEDDESYYAYCPPDAEGACGTAGKEVSGPSPAAQRMRDRASPCGPYANPGEGAGCDSTEVHPDMKAAVSPRVQINGACGAKAQPKPEGGCQGKITKSPSPAAQSFTQRTSTCGPYANPGPDGSCERTAREVPADRKGFVINVRGWGA